MPVWRHSVLKEGLLLKHLLASAAFLLAITPAVDASAQAAPCGKDAPCTIENGDYHLITPSDWDGTTALPALVWFHGHNSSAASVFRSGGLRTDFVNNGYVLIAPNGEKRQNSKTQSWPGRITSTGRDDVAFTLSVLEDAKRQVPVDPDRIYVSGFSAGGSMAWMMGCYAAETFAGVVSVSGALRRPIPETVCPAGSFNLLQIHGFADGQVPYEGRGIRDWHQGDIFEALGLLRETNQCRSNPDEITIGEQFRCREWSGSCENGGIKFCEHDGGHGLPRGWTALARDWLEAQHP